MFQIPRQIVSQERGLGSSTFAGCANLMIAGSKCYDCALYAELMEEIVSLKRSFTQLESRVDFEAARLDTVISTLYDNRVVRSSLREITNLIYCRIAFTTAWTPDMLSAFSLAALANASAFQDGVDVASMLCPMIIPADQTQVRCFLLCLLPCLLSCLLPC